MGWVFVVALAMPLSWGSPRWVTIPVASPGHDIAMLLLRR
jgi:hypothetical protein